MMLSRLENCQKHVMMILSELARMIHGYPAMWDAAIVSRLGAIPGTFFFDLPSLIQLLVNIPLVMFLVRIFKGGLEPSHFMKIKPDSFSGFTPLAVEAMYDANLKVG